MNIEKTLSILSGSLEETAALGTILGRNLRGGEVIELRSDIGGGKTTFTKAIVAGAGSSDAVSSPSFTISKQYDTPTFTIYHFDLYRLGTVGIISDMLEETAYNSQDVLIVEWADVANDSLPKDRVIIKIEKITDDSRRFDFTCPDSKVYLLKGFSR